LDCKIGRVDLRTISLEQAEEILRLGSRYLRAVMKRDDRKKKSCSKERLFLE